ncbi:hypothetical protein Tco_1285849 [Tanacetum coccineum]
MSDSEDFTVTYTEVEAALQALTSPDYVPSPEYPPSPDFVSEPPLPAAVSPTSNSPGYITESDPEEDPEEGDEDPEEDPTDYPIDRDDEEEEDESFRKDADDEEEDEDEEEEEEHPFSCRLPLHHPMSYKLSGMSKPDQTPISIPDCNRRDDKFLLPYLLRNHHHIHHTHSATTTETISTTEDFKLRTLEL